MQPPLNVLLEAAVMHFVQYSRDAEQTERRLILLYGTYGASEVVECIELLQAYGLKDAASLGLESAESSNGHWRKLSIVKECNFAPDRRDNG